VWVGKPERKKNCLKDLGVNGRVILKINIKKVVCEGADWYGSGKGRWQGAVNAVMNLCVSQIVGNLLTGFSRTPLGFGGNT
jgi:hypothetical protein